MSHNHVDRETALALQKAGWKGETATIWVYRGGTWSIVWSDELDKRYANKWLPAPSIGELRERLEYADFTTYCPLGWLSRFDKWLYTITASANALARVWLWKVGKEVP